MSDKMIVTGVDVIGGITGAEQIEQFIRGLQEAGIRANVTPVPALANTDAGSFSGNTSETNGQSVTGTGFSQQDVKVARDGTAHVVIPAAAAKEEKETSAVETVATASGRSETVAAQNPAQALDPVVDADRRIAQLEKTQANDSGYNPITNAVLAKALAAVSAGGANIAHDSSAQPDHNSIQLTASIPGGGKADLGKTA